jgi:DNA polymerase III subunit epsilon
MPPLHRLLLPAAGLAAIVLVVVGLWAAGLWAQLGAEERRLLQELLTRRPLYPLVLPFFLVAVLAIVVFRFVLAYPAALRSMASQVRALAAANPAHRVETGGAAETRELADALNAFADRHQALLCEMEERVRAARGRVEEERNRLAALISELSEGVVVCGDDGQIILYNRRAKQLLEVGGDGDEAGIVGLGRSIYRLLSRGALEHALESLRRRWEKDDPNLLSRFVTGLPGGRLLRTHLIPVVDTEARRISGYVLTLDDITRKVEADRAREAALRGLTEGVRGSLGNLRAAVETLETHREMEPAEARRFREIICHEALALSDALEGTVEELAGQIGPQWLMEEMLASDLLATLERRLTEAGTGVTVAHAADGLWLQIDGYRVVELVTAIADWLRRDLGVHEIALRAEPSGRYARLEVAWNGRALSAETMRAWQDRPISLGATERLSLREMMDRHGGEAWSEAGARRGTASLRMLLPTAQPDPALVLRAGPGSRPETYDFDLFNQPGQWPDLDERALAELAYTVFDTETTGLDPSGGDEIVSLSAVRIVNGRLLREERFDQRVNPLRSISPESVAVHGISTEDLRDAPTLAEVLPRFHAFADETVLVAHNAAFDMRFLQLKEEATGVRFTQPVLDTLLLSAVVHPTETDHTLEGIARRLGVPVEGRHTSLGDTLATAGILLRLIPLLAEHGIRTLGEARTASQATMFARLRY